MTFAESLAIGEFGEEFKNMLPAELKKLAGETETEIEKEVPPTVKKIADTLGKVISPLLGIPPILLEQAAAWLTAFWDAMNKIIPEEKVSG